MSKSSIPQKYRLQYKGKTYSLHDLIMMKNPSLEWFNEISKMRNEKNMRISKYEIASAFMTYERLTPDLEKKLTDKVGTIEKNYYVDEYKKEQELLKESEHYMEMFKNYISDTPSIHHYEIKSKNYSYTLTFDMKNDIPLRQLFDNIITDDFIVYVSLMNNGKLIKFSKDPSISDIMFSHKEDAIYMKIYLSLSVGSKYRNNIFADVIIDTVNDEIHIEFNYFKGMDPKRQLSLFIKIFSERCKDIEIMGSDQVMEQQMEFIIPNIQIDYSVFLEIIFNVPEFIHILYVLESELPLSGKKYLKFYLKLHDNVININIHNDMTKNRIKGISNGEFYILSAKSPFVNVNITGLKNSDKNLVMNFIYKAFILYQDNYLTAWAPYKVIDYWGDERNETYKEELEFYEYYRELNGSSEPLKTISKMGNSDIKGVLIVNDDDAFEYPPIDSKEDFRKDAVTVYLKARDPNREIGLKENTETSGFFNNIDFPCIPAAFDSGRSNINKSCSEILSKRSTSTKHSTRKLKSREKGSVDVTLSNILGVNDGDIERELFTNENSLIYTIALIMGYSQDDNPEKVIKGFMQSIYNDMRSGKIHPCMAREELYDASNDEIMNMFKVSLNEKEREIIYEEWKSFLEYIITANIYIFEKGRSWELVYPRHKNYYIVEKEPTYKECVIFIRVNGNYELVAPRDTFFFLEDVNKRVNHIFYDLFHSEFTEKPFNFSGLDIVSQYIEYDGKVTMVTTKDGVSLVIPRSRPQPIKCLNIMKLSRVPLSLIKGENIRLDVSNWSVVYEINKQTVSSLIEQTDAKLPLIENKIILQKKEENITSSILSSKRNARLLKEIFGTFCLMYGKDDFFNVYVVEVPNTHTYRISYSNKTINDMNITIPSFVENGKILIKSNMMDKMRRLSQYLIDAYNRGSIVLMPNPKFSNPYEWKVDFKSSNVYFGEFEALQNAFINERLSNGQVVTSIMPQKVIKKKIEKYDVPIDPLFYKKEDKLYIVQFVQESGYEKITCQDICNNWRRYGVNSGYFTESLGYNMSYPIIELSHNGQLEDIKGPSIMKYADMRYAAVLPFL